MKIGITRPVEVEVKTLRIHTKVTDRFCASLHDQDGAELCCQEDVYVPSFMPGQHFGDYIILDIDIDTGVVLNWTQPTAEQLTSFIAPADEY